MSDDKTIEELCESIDETLPHYLSDEEASKLRLRINTYAKKKLRDTAFDASDRLHNCVYTLITEGYVQTKSGKWVKVKK